MISLARRTNTIELPLVSCELSMIPFDLASMAGLPSDLVDIAVRMLKGISHEGGTAFFTIHGKRLKKGETLRRGGAHIDGNYDPHVMTFGGGGWKVGQDGRPVGHPVHDRQFNQTTGGIILASNYHACNGWIGEYDGTPEKGGDCTHFDLDEPFKLESNTVYYGNNHFIHESLPMNDDVHRVFARITMPEKHRYSAKVEDME